MIRSHSEAGGIGGGSDSIVRRVNIEVRLIRWDWTTGSYKDGTHEGLEGKCPQRRLASST